MKKLVALIMILPAFAMAQGIRFEESLSWQQLKEKAKTENKYIFMDVFTTWCGPCKAMASKVFPTAEAGNYFNDKFISVQVQMDSSKNDNEYVKSWYASAKNIGTEYKVTAYPTLLFFNPQGHLVHKLVGYKDAASLVTEAKDAVDPSKQYYTRIAQYNAGKLKREEFPALARQAKTLGEKEISKKIGAQYIKGIKEKDLYTEENIKFLGEYTAHTTDRGFNVFFKNPSRINEIMKKPFFAEGYIDYWIGKDYIDEPYLVPAGKTDTKDLDWATIHTNITKKYGKSYADRITTGAQTRWYGFKKMWPEFAKAKILMMEKYDRPDSKKRDDFYWGFAVNNDAWSFFEHITDKDQLTYALGWAKMVIEHTPKDANNLDTYANLLYKLGRKEEAIAAETKAVGLDPKNTSLQETLDKMKAGQPTWPQQ